MSLFDAEFYDLDIHAGDSIARLAYSAKKCGYSGIALINSAVTQETVFEQDGFAVYRGIEITSKPAKLREEVTRHKESMDLLIVKGGNEETNRAAVETAGVDILLQPLQFNHVLAKAAVDNSVAIGFNIGSIIRSRGTGRMKEFMTMRNNLKHARKYDVQMVLTTDAHSIYDLRAPREMSALASLFGMTQEEAVKAMSGTPLGILHRKSPHYIQEGIEII